MKRVVLVNGVPASGKSALAARLLPYLHAEGLAAVPFALDTVKEALFDHVGTGDRDHNRMLGRASYQAIFDTIAAFPDDLVPVIDAWHGFQPDTVLRDHLARAGVARVIELWCDIPPETAAVRYRARSAVRRPGHPPASYADELLELARCACPVSLGPVVRARGDGPPDDPAPLRAVADLLRTGGPTNPEGGEM
ncbi:AAA family ATPase [Meridianimarinicoccus sp. RP-17]|uniref:AAA family ATPase n=1 Tax=Meridianimarinicoccus zhengii TaxID=2056810 RepID=UPI0013A6D788|nr:AAA family ATPase [Phycocomes zhengii]